MYVSIKLWGYHHGCTILWIGLSFKCILKVTWMNDYLVLCEGTFNAIEKSQRKVVWGRGEGEREREREREITVHSHHFTLLQETSHFLCNNTTIKDACNCYFLAGQ